jgi:2-C-methyl-D-erythritol 2,4-cyclodiphosphate synthase
MRVGIGYDIHALKKGRDLILGGVNIPHSKGLQGHSDGDVLFHAIVDALLGAAAEGDIGDHFSDKDARYRGANSLLFVKKVKEILKRRRFKIEHIDSVILAEAPKLAAFKAKIRASVAQAFGLPLSSVSVKAKTNEGFGAVGKKQAIACYAVASLGEN